MSKENTEALDNENSTTEVTVGETLPAETTELAKVDEGQPEPLPKFETLEERMEAMSEIAMLNDLIKTTYYQPRYDAGNKGRRSPKITGSTPLNYWHPSLLDKWGKKIVELTERL